MKPRKNCMVFQSSFPRLTLLKHESLCKAVFPTGFAFVVDEPFRDGVETSFIVYFFWKKTWERF